MQLSQSTIAAVLATESPDIRRDGAVTAFALTCSVDGAPACRFSTGSWNDPALAPIAERVVDEIGWKTIEHAPRHRILVRCETPDGAPARGRCWIDRGNGLEPLPFVTDL